MATLAAPVTAPTSRTAGQLLLGCGIAAGPAYLILLAVQATTRDGFDPRVHAGSLLMLGEGGWVQSANFLLTGLLVVLGAIGLRRIGGVDGSGGRWAPRLLTGYGAGTAAAGLFRPDPAFGFPLGTPDGPALTASWTGTAHLGVGAVGFIAFVAWCLVVGRQLRATGARRWAVASFATGVLFLAAFAGIASGSAGAGVTLGFWAAIGLAWTWLTVVLVRCLVHAR